MKDLRGLPWHLTWLFSAGFEKCVSMYRLKTTVHYQVMHDDTGSFEAEIEYIYFFENLATFNRQQPIFCRVFIESE